MKLAVYKGTRPGFAGLFNILVRWWLAGKYSHCELVFSDGVCASSSFLDHGVRFKTIEFSPDKWDMFNIEGNEDLARKWFLAHVGDKYDVWGLIGFIIRPIKGYKNKWICSEAILEALGYEDSWRFDPCVLAVLPTVIREQE